MEIKILLAYATTHGATEEIAEAVAGTLREHGLAVDVQLAKNVRSLEGYSAVVLGAPMYMFKLHRDAKRFLARHQAAFGEGLPLAVFSGGPFGDSPENVWQEVRGHLDKELARFPSIQPVAIEIVGGRFDPNRLRFPYNLIPAMKNQPVSDLRDWEKIRAWAAGLAERFRAA